MDESVYIRDPYDVFFVSHSRELHTDFTSGLLYAICFIQQLNWQVGRALKFDGNCGEKQTKKNAPFYSA